MQANGFGVEHPQQHLQGAAGIGLRVGLCDARFSGGRRQRVQGQRRERAGDRRQRQRAVQVSGNVFKANGFAPGSHVDASGNPLTSGVWAGSGTFTGNRAIGNAGHGIEAYGVTDGGANTAKGNGAEPQCIGVVCTWPARRTQPSGWLHQGLS